MGIILISGNGVAMPWLHKIPALMQSWYLGSETGTATANAISGEVNPSGRLPFTIPKRWEDNGAMSFGQLSYPGDSIRQVYMEDILVGYRWHDTKKIPAQFPFGYGLSYTTFEYGDIAADRKIYEKDDVIKLSITIRNKGEKDGKETIQVYSSQSAPSLMRPQKELKGFKKVFLKAGESKSVQIDIPVKELGYFDDRLHQWVVEKDKFILQCAASSTDIKDKISIMIQ